MNEEDFKFRRTPYELQRAVWSATKDRRNFALFWEQGCGKTLAAVTTAQWLYQTGQIDAVFVLAPTDLHANWDVPGEGIRTLLDEELLKNSCRLTWDTGRAGTKHFARRLDNLMTHKKGMRWLFMGFDAFVTERGAAAARAFLTTYRCLWVVDEAGRIKNPTSKRTKKIMKMRDLAAFRRPMTGTPTTEKPFDVYSIVQFMDPFYWKRNGFGNYHAFTRHFGVWKKIHVAMGREIEVQAKDRDGRTRYQNLDELARLLRPISSRVLKEDMVDLPPKTYTRMYYEMSNMQRKHYDRLEQDFMTWYDANTVPDAETGGRMFVTSADLAIVRQLRLQQIALGYLVDDTDKSFHLIDERPNSLRLLGEVVEDLDHPAIIWGRFRKDVDLICEMLGDRAVRYDGTVDGAGRIAAVQAFQGGKVPFFVATPATAGEGLTLTAARTVIYYSNSFRLTEREQSEARAHRIGQRYAVQYIDLLARNSIAEDILDVLSHKQASAAAAIGDRMRLRLSDYVEA